MKTIFRLFFLVLLLVGWGLAALSLHVVRAPGTPEKIVLIPKNTLGISYTYVDMRAWTMEDIAKNGPIVQRMIDTGKSDLLATLVEGGKPEKSDHSSEIKSKLQNAIDRHADAGKHEKGVLAALGEQAASTWLGLSK